MIIYIEDLIADNIIPTFLACLLSYRATAKKASVIRSVIASALSTVVAFTYPFVSKAVVSVSIKIALWLADSAILYHKKQKFWISALTFLGITLGMGGLSYAIGLALLPFSSAVGKDSVLLSPWLVVCSAVAFFLVAREIYLKNRRAGVEERLRYEVGLTLFGKKYLLSGIMDTGNRLYDSASGLPVVVLKISSVAHALSDSVLSAIVGGKAERMPGARYMSYSTVAGGVNKILVVPPQDFYVKKDGRLKRVDVVIGISFAAFSTDYDLILHPSII